MVGYDFKNMSENKSIVDLVTSEEQEYEYYRDYLNGLAQSNPVSTEIFNNSGEIHASILMATLLANTEKKLNMYCQGLRPGILCGMNEGDGMGLEGTYWQTFRSFFNEKISKNNFGENSVRILIQKVDWVDYQPFKVVRSALKSCNTGKCKKIVVKLIEKENEKKIESLLGNIKNNDKESDESDYNFSVYDDKAFRLEYEPNKYRAIGSFNCESWSSQLNGIFDKAFSSAMDITDKLSDGKTVDQIKDYVRSLESK